MAFNEAGGADVGTFGTITLTSLADDGIQSPGWTKIASLKNTQRDVFYLHMTRVHTVNGTVANTDPSHGDGSAVAIQYDLETSRDTDTIEKTYFATSMFEGVWLDSNLSDSTMIERYGVFGFNYHNQYTVNKGSGSLEYVSGTQIPTNGNVVDVQQAIIQGRSIDYSWERVGYLMPHTKIEASIMDSVFKSGEDYSTSEYGIRGIGYRKMVD